MPPSLTAIFECAIVASGPLSSPRVCKDTRSPATKQYLDFKPAPGCVHLAQVLLHKRERREACLPFADQAHALGMQPEVVVPNLQTLPSSQARAALPHLLQCRQAAAPAGSQTRQSPRSIMSARHGSANALKHRWPRNRAVTFSSLAATAAAALALGVPASRFFMSSSACFRFQPLSPCKFQRPRSELQPDGDVPYDLRNYRGLHTCEFMAGASTVSCQ